MSKDFLLAKVSHLVGLTIVTSSLNVGRVKALGPGGLRVDYVKKPTEQDMKEIEEYLLSKMDPGTKATIKDYGKHTPESDQKEVEDYRKFLAGDD